MKHQSGSTSYKFVTPEELSLDDIPTRDEIKEQIYSEAVQDLQTIFESEHSTPEDLLYFHRKYHQVLGHRRIGRMYMRMIQDLESEGVE